ncbi:hypothetical protein CORC01_07497 [Colletotrichum orchidophilum]|uniref:DUF7357 domain-containing protein n=1 Tax=Colletotrichum orchidophilum TaxID=1209926 RepID=A0A1G4B7G7_9PEZI|nr:uncharacterized protein CORC01_07497 [Colletotrichum orchidophilum]OHE97243.1 hypothetical protein CORC01_07497 [Colletotrichum orchidophilum]
MEKDLRLRLVVRRHGVPDVKLLWNVTANDDLTISKLVTQVNEVIPLEGGEWGLEDYAVELKDASGDGFECVHYHLVSKVLKDDDQILIRPLLTGDLKRRRLSGRHQISADGKHLVDGLAFGRPWLRAPRDRPAVTLPPRKKARITYTGEDEEDSPSEAEVERPMLEYESTRAQEDPSSVQLRTRFYDADLDSNSEEDEEDFEPAAADDDDECMDSENDDIQDELRMLREDNAAVREGDILEELRNIRDRRASTKTASSSRPLETSDDSPVPSASNALVRSGGKSSRFQLNLDTLDKIAALRSAFPSAQVSTIENTLLRCGTNPARAWRKLHKTFEPRLSLQQTLDHQARSLSSSPIRNANSSTGRELVLRESSPLERASDAISQDYDEEDENDEDGSDEASETLNHNAHTDQGSTGIDESSASDSVLSSEGAISDSDQEMGSASDKDSEASSSDDESDNESSEAEGSGPVISEANSDSVDEEASSSDDDSSSGSSTSDGSSVASTKERLSARQAAIVEVSSDSSSDSSSDDSSSEDSSSDSEPEELPSKTLSSQRILFDVVKHNESTKLPQAAPVAAAQPKQQQPDVPPGQGLSKTQKRNARRKLAKKLAVQKRSPSAQNSEGPSSAEASGISEEQAAFLARKQALLNAITSDGAASKEDSPEIPDSAPQEVEATNTGLAMMETLQSSAAREAASQRRTKPNVGAARRMLMGSLGLKNPKTKADEDKIRQDLMKGVRPHTNARLLEGASQPDESEQTQESVEEDPEAWREKIAYRAVECCHEGVELSEPPFPFVQRWDPQQQVEEWFGSKNKRGGKRKRVQRDQAQYYEGGDSQSSKKRRVTDDSFGVTFSDAVESAQEGDTTLNYDDPSDDPSAAKIKAGESQATDVDDLPSLPTDLSTLPDLRPGEAKLGMVITWKQLALSSQTNWQPQVVSLTGVLVRIHDEDATDLEFILAHRDRGVDRTEKTYDEETGERVYDRFEAPDDDEEDEDADNGLEDGHRRVNYMELIEPKVVQLPLDDDTKEGENEKSNVSQGESGPTDSVIHETIYDGQSQPSEANGENAGQSEVGEDGSQSQVDATKSRAKANTDEQQPQVATGSKPRLGASLGGNQPSHKPSAHSDGDEDDMDESDVHTPRAKRRLQDDNTVPTTEDADSQNSNGNALSISSDRRHEISIMIEEAGFRKDVSPSVIQRKTSSPSRQLLEMLKAANTPRAKSKSPLSQESIVKNATPVPDNCGDAAIGATDDGGLPPPSSVSSIHSGRQLDPDGFSFNMVGDDLPQISNTGHGSPSVEASTPRAQVHTPTREEDTSEPNSAEKSSLPSLESLFKTASQRNSQKNTQSSSKSQVLSAIESPKSIVPLDEQYEAAIRRIDEADEDEENEEEDEESPPELRKTRKRLFSNSSQPEGQSLFDSSDLPDLRLNTKSAPSSFIETEETKPRLLRERVRAGSPFVVPPGSQVVTLSSSPPSSPLEENSPEDNVDMNYDDDNSSSLPHGSGWVQKNKPSKVNPRAKSVPATGTTARSATTGRSIPPSSIPARSGTKGKGPRKSSTNF